MNLEFDAGYSCWNLVRTLEPPYGYQLENFKQHHYGIQRLNLYQFFFSQRR